MKNNKLSVSDCLSQRERLMLYAKKLAEIGGDPYYVAWVSPFLTEEDIPDFNSIGTQTPDIIDTDEIEITVQKN